MQGAPYVGHPGGGVTQPEDGHGTLQRGDTAADGQGTLQRGDTDAEQVVTLHLRGDCKKASLDLSCLPVGAAAPPPGPCWGSLGRTSCWRCGSWGTIKVNIPA